MHAQAARLRHRVYQAGERRPRSQRVVIALGVVLRRDFARRKALHEARNAGRAEAGAVDEQFRFYFRIACLKNKFR